MHLLSLIRSIPDDFFIRLQVAAAIAIYGAIVFAAIALAMIIAYESMFQRGDGRRDEVIVDDDDHALSRAA